MDREDRHILRRQDFDALLGALARRGYTLIGPTVRDQAIVYGEIGGASDLPVGWTDDQGAGRYRLRRRGDQALFGFAAGPDSLKRYQLPAELTLWRARTGARGELEVCEEPSPRPNRYAFIGVRSCELHAAGILDTVLTGGAHPDPGDRARIADRFIVAVQCGDAGGTCFCVSMATGPVADAGFDLALTEIIDGSEHYFVVQVGSDPGAAVLADVPHTSAGSSQRAAADAAHAHAAAQMGRAIDTDGLKELLYRNLEHPRWQQVADRCLTCGNCTMVCPTCFCTTVEDVTDLSGAGMERRQRWDSCFTVDYSHINGGPVRATAQSRYRQWMTHKLASWWDQFDTSGCVGCGRCITWCPVGIDITEEAAAIRRDDGLSETKPTRGRHART
ncbi:MAG TPA: 4Fe-4S dicluster domain-containing protein [Solirubrobacteraceae bacterium]|nr:4Fe-4S dicluster domain-containing protein [Solirubrobacteraceae bacterium]